MGEPVTGGGPGYSSTTLSILTITTARVRLDFGYAAALSMYLAMLLAVVAAVYFVYRGKFDAWR